MSEISTKDSVLKYITAFYQYYLNGGVWTLNKTDILITNFLSKNDSTAEVKLEQSISGLISSRLNPQEIYETLFLQGYFKKD